MKGRKPTQAASAKSLLRAALARVESASIRKWATGGDNAAIWYKIAMTAVKNGKSPRRPDDVAMLSAYIVATAMGM